MKTPGQPNYYRVFVIIFLNSPMSKYRHVLFWTCIIFTLISCGNALKVTRELIQDNYPINKGFEMAKLNVQTIHKRKKHPIDYTKSEIHICFLNYPANNSAIARPYSKIDEYWTYQDSLDLKSENWSSKNGIKKVYFYQVQPNIKWVQFPFDENKITDTLQMKFEPDSWYKVSHIHPLIDNHLYFYITPEGELKVY